LSEIDRFLTTPTLKVNDPLQWWADNAETYPSVSRMGRDYLSIPTTAVDVERVFSKGRLCLSHIRNRLSAQTTRALLCVGEWSRLDLISADDLNQAASLPDLDEEEEEAELVDGWDRIAASLTM
ncbi:hATC-domain-containing protein, partial [Dichomitus squalens LYAD-421 SS1]|uniref:hATC-domain-containing protein n=1 Tax=Dichomitus squalens (strain LYAD-421) TaxID=732165 RepID=UPI0004410D59